MAADFTGEPAVDQVIYDLLSALNITGYVQGDEVYYVIGMTQESGAVADLLTMGIAMAGEDTYLLSNLIGGTIVVAQDEVQPLAERLIDMLVVMGAFTERDAEMMKAAMAESFAGLNVEANAAAGLDSVDFTALDYSALTDMVAGVWEKAVVGEADVLPKNCDTPASMVTITMTPDEMKSLIASVLHFVKENPDLANAIAAEIAFDETIAPEVSGVSGDPVDFLGFIDMMIAELNEQQLYTGDTTARVWLDEAGMPVAISVIAPVEGGEMSVDHNRLTMNDVVLNSFRFAFPGGDVTLDVVEDKVSVNFAVAENGETRIAVKADYTDRSAENLIAGDLMLDITITDVTVNNEYTYNGESYSESDDVEEVNIGIAVTSDTVVDGVDVTETDRLVISVNGKQYATVNVIVASGEAGASITTGDVVRPAELSDADFANWFIGAFNSLYTWVQNAIFAMPTSLINLMNTGF